MLSDLRRESRLNSGDKVFEGVPVGSGKPICFKRFSPPMISPHRPARRSATT